MDTVPVDTRSDLLKNLAEERARSVTEMKTWLLISVVVVSFLGIAIAAVPRKAPACWTVSCRPAEGSESVEGCSYYDRAGELIESWKQESYQGPGVQRRRIYLTNDESPADLYEAVKGGYPMRLPSEGGK
jgi:hypothetical protein